MHIKAKTLHNYYAKKLKIVQNQEKSLWCILNTETPAPWVMKFTISGLLPLQMLQTKFGKVRPCRYSTDEQHTTNDDECQPIAITVNCIC